MSTFFKGVFTATNGVQVEWGGEDEPLAWRANNIDTWNNDLAFDEGSMLHVALSEFFRAERDASIKRWRSKRRPNFIVRPVRGVQESADQQVIEVFHEPTFMLWQYRGRPGGPRAEDSLVNGGSLKQKDFDAVANEWFAEYFPEPQEWAGAADGEIWELSGVNVNASRPAQYLVDNHRFFRLPLLTAGHRNLQPAFFASEFTSGKRVWPPVSETDEGAS